MAKQILEYRCLLISPSDVENERKIIEEVVLNWNAHIGNVLGARIELVRWERHSTPEFGDSPQNIINKQLLDNCDLGVAIFWSRLGSPTEKYASGSVEEIYELSARGCPVIVYFSNQDIPQTNIDNDQFQNLQKVKSELLTKGLLASYDEVYQLKDKFQLHLTSQVSKLISRDKNFGDSKDDKLTAPKPDIKVKVNNSVAFHSTFDTISFLCVEVENHSSTPVFVGNVYLRENNGGLLYTFEDYVSKSRSFKEKLEPGDSLSFNIDPAVFIEAKKKILCAVFKDKIGRIYESDPLEFEKKVKIVLEQYYKNGENKIFDKIRPPFSNMI